MLHILSVAVTYIYICICILQENGCDFDVQGLKETFYGTVAVISADNPASNSSGGFKESTIAFRYCRLCMGTVKKLGMRYE